MLVGVLVEVVQALSGLLGLEHILKVSPGNQKRLLSAWILAWQVVSSVEKDSLAVRKLSRSFLRGKEGFWLHAAASGDLYGFRIEAGLSLFFGIFCAYTYGLIVRKP